MSVFEVAITPAGNAGSFRVDVLNSPDGGVASAVAGIDVDSLLAKRHDLEVAVLLSGVTGRKVFPEEQQLREVGRVLFHALLGTGEVAGKYRAAAAVAEERGEGLRVVLRVADPALAALPWEAMFDDAAGGYVCRRDQLIRHVGVLTATAPLPVDPPLRILGVVSSPSGLPGLEVEREKEILSRVLARAAGPLAEVTWAPAATWADLQDTLLSRTWHVVHFIGHGDFDRELDEGVLALTDDDGGADLVAASRLVSLLRQARPGPRLVVLNSCSGAAANVTNLFSGTATALVRGGIGAVTALYQSGQDSRLFTVRPASAAAEPADAPARTRAPARAQTASGTGSGPPVPSRLVRTIRAHSDGVFRVRFSPDGTLLGSAGADGAVRLWDVATGAEAGAFTSKGNLVRSVAFWPDGALIASGWSDGAVRLFATASIRARASPRTAAALKPDPDSPLSGTSDGGLLAFSPDPDASLLVSAGADGTIRVWE